MGSYSTFFGENTPNHLLPGNSNQTIQQSTYLKYLTIFLKIGDITQSKVTCAVTDNGANMVFAIKKSLGDAKHLPNFAHTINLIVESSLKNSSTTITSVVKVGDIVKWVKNSVIQWGKLRKIQIDNGAPEGCTKIAS